MELTTNCMLKILANPICMIYLDIILFNVKFLQIHMWEGQPQKSHQLFLNPLQDICMKFMRLLWVCESFQSFRDFSLSCPFILPHSCSYSCNSCQARGCSERLRSPSLPQFTSLSIYAFTNTKSFLFLIKDLKV